MAIQHRFLLLIYTLCCVAIIHGYLLDINDAETCNLLCGQCNASGVFANGLCECSFTDNNNEGAECIQRIQKEIQAIDLNILSDDSTDEERNVRSILRRRRLRLGDADKVAQYFINGGPAAGHSHFVRAFNEAYDSTDSAKNSFSGAVDESSPENGFHSASLIHPISRSTCDSPLYLVPGNADGNQNNGENAYARYASNVEAADPNIVYSSSGLYDLTNSLLGAISHPHRTHGQGLHHVLLKTASLPAHALHNLLVRPHHHPVYHHGYVRNAYPQTVSYVGQHLGRCGGSVDPSVSSIAMNNVDKPIERNVVTPIPVPVASQVQYSPHIPYNYGINAQPVQYRSFGYPYRYVYQNPVFKVLYPITDNYYARPDTYIQGTPGPMISAPNPYHYCTNNANTEQSSTIPTATGNSFSNNEAEKSNDAIKDNISKKEKKTEKDGNNKL